MRQSIARVIQRLRLAGVAAGLRGSVAKTPPASSQVASGAAVALFISGAAIVGAGNTFSTYLAEARQGGPGSELRFTTFLNRTISYEEGSGSSGAGYRYTPDLKHIDRALAAYGLETAKPVAPSE